MIKRIVGFAALLLIVSSLGGFFTATEASAAPAQISTVSEVSTAAAVDYCGKDDWTRWVPERPLGFDFSQDCRQHDICRSSYSNTHNNAMFCHDQFYWNMDATCQSSYAGWQQPACRLARDVYYRGVVAFNTPA